MEPLRFGDGNMMVTTVAPVAPLCSKVVSQLASGIRTDTDAEGGLFPGFIGEIDAADLQSLRAAVEASKFQFFEASRVVALC